LKIMIVAVNKMKWKVEHYLSSVIPPGFMEIVAEKAIKWFLDHHDLVDDDPNEFGHRIIELRLRKYDDISCWGWSSNEPGYGSSYEMEIAVDQPLRDFIATVMHEMVHILQWETCKWEDDGEKEAEDTQYELTDEFWKAGII
jgi:hypothetical protein